MPNKTSSRRHSPEGATMSTGVDGTDGKKKRHSNTNGSHPEQQHQLLHPNQASSASETSPGRAGNGGGPHPITPTSNSAASSSTALDLKVIDDAFGNTSDLYTDVLQVSTGATQEEIQLAYFDRRSELFTLLAKIDSKPQAESMAAQRYKAERKMDSVVLAVRILGDASLRSTYDHQIRPRRVPSTKKKVQKQHQQHQQIMTMEHQQRQQQQQQQQQQIQSSTRRSRSASRARTSSRQPSNRYDVPHQGSGGNNGTTTNVADDDMMMMEQTAIEMQPQSLTSIPTPASPSSSGRNKKSKKRQHNNNSDETNNNNNNSGGGGGWFGFGKNRNNNNNNSNTPATNTTSRNGQISSMDTFENDDRDGIGGGGGGVSGAESRQEDSDTLSQTMDGETIGTLSTYDRDDTVTAADTLDDDDHDGNVKASSRKRKGSFADGGGDKTKSRSKGGGIFSCFSGNRTLRAISDEISGACEDTLVSVDQVFNAFTLTDKDIKAVTKKIDKAKRQLDS